jgi:hypothetical protein
MKRIRTICLGLVVLGVAPLWAQVENSPQSEESQPEATVINHPEDRMQTPPPVTGLSSPTVFTTEGRANYLRYGIAFTTAYTDNGLGSISGKPISDVNYSIAPIAGIHEVTPRLDLEATYAPGFTFYQRTSSLNESDQNASLNLAYRLTPHVTLSARDGFQRTSNIFNQPDFGSAGAVSGGAQVPNFSIIAPTASRLSNAGNLSLTYQFALNEMAGVDGRFTTLHYPNSSQVPGLYDASSQGGSFFYSVRVSNVHYFGASYQYQRLVSYPTAGQDETQAHAVVLFYTVYPTPHVSISFFAGPQYAETVNAASPVQVAKIGSWSPAAGGSLAWGGRQNSLALSYSHVIADGGGLLSAVHMDSGAVSFGRQLRRNLSGSVTGMYTNNTVIGTYLAQRPDGHSLYGTVSLQQRLGAHLTIQGGYTRLHQSYGSIPLISTNPDTNREFLMLSYQLSRPLGR